MTNQSPQVPLMNDQQKEALILMAQADIARLNIALLDLQFKNDSVAAEEAKQLQEKIVKTCKDIYYVSQHEHCEVWTGTQGNRKIDCIGLFIKWGTDVIENRDSDYFQYTVAIVMKPDGQICTVLPDNIRMIGKPELHPQRRVKVNTQTVVNRAYVFTEGTFIGWSTVKDSSYPADTPQTGTLFAIVKYDDGAVHRILPHLLTFIGDSAEQCRARPSASGGVHADTP